MSLCWVKGNWSQEWEHVQPFRFSASLAHPLRVFWLLNWGVGGTNLVATLQFPNQAARDALWLVVTYVGKVGGLLHHCTKQPPSSGQAPGKALIMLPALTDRAHISTNESCKFSSSQSCVRSLLGHLSGILIACNSRKALWLGKDCSSRPRWQGVVSRLGQPALL